MSLQVGKPLQDLLETEWDAIIFRGADSLARLLGWLTYHTLRSKGSHSGYPDRTCVRDRVLFVELKREPAIGKQGQPLKLLHPLSRDQREWLDRIVKSGTEAYVWIPSDWEEIKLILGHVWRLEGTTLTSKTFASWTPGSMWIAGEGRADGRLV